MAQSIISLSENTAQGFSRSFCSGTIISSNAILSAAHCLAGKAPQNIWVTFGTDGLQSTTLKPATQIFIHPRYQVYGSRLPNVKDNGDLAILTFDGGLPFGYRPALLATSLQDLKTKSPVFIAGFGIPNHGILSACQTAIQNLHFSNTEIELYGFSSCSPNGGDSGGPTYLIKNNRVVVLAIHNWGWHDEQSQPLYSVEASVPYYLEWLHSIVKTP